MLYVQVNSFKASCNIKEINAHKKLIKNLLLKAHHYVILEAEIFKNWATKKAFINVVITNDIYMEKLNKKYRNIIAPTNVISLQIETKENIITGEVPEHCYLGEIFLSLDTILKEANLAKISFSEHFCRVGIHGYLHLLGFDHYNEITTQEMKKLEDKILQYCKINTNSIIVNG